MVTGKVGGTIPTALGTAWATGSWRKSDERVHTIHGYVNSIMV